MNESDRVRASSRESVSECLKGSERGRSEWSQLESERVNEPVGRLEGERGR